MPNVKCSPKRDLDRSCLPATFRADTGGRPVVSFPDFPNAHTDGKDAADAMEEATDCLGSVIARRIAERLDIPAPSRPLASISSQVT